MKEKFVRERLPTNERSEREGRRERTNFSETEAFSSVSEKKPKPKVYHH